jgi:shikimate kinase
VDGSTRHSRDDNASGVLLAISGPVAAGKTSLAQALHVATQGEILSTRDLIRARARDLSRTTLQEAGEYLDRELGGRWVSAPAARLRRLVPVHHPIIVDAVRTEEQLAALRGEARVIHVHLTADLGSLMLRYEHRRARRPELELDNYAALHASRTEKNVAELGRIADLVIDTDAPGIDAVCRRALRFMKEALTLRVDPET